MKHLFLFALVLITLSVSAQSPQVINYQATARRIDGSAISNKSLGINFQLLQGGSTGSVLVTETQTVVTNQLGLFNTQIGKTSSLQTLNWDSADLYLKTSIDTMGGTNFVELSVQQLVSVPFAFRASSVPSSFTNNVLTIGNKSYTLASVTNDTYSPGTNVNISGTSPNFTISATPSLTLLSPNTLSISGGNTVDIAPTLSISNNVLTVGPTNNTVALPASLPTTITNSGIGTITSLGTNSFDINIPQPSLAINANSLSVIGGNTVVLPAQAQTTITTSGIGTVTSSGTNSFNINIPATPQTSLTSTGIGTISSAGTNSFNINIPQPILSLSGSNLSVSGGNTVVLPSQITSTLTSSGIGTITSLGTNSFDINVPQPSLSINSNSLSLVGGNTVILPSQAQTSITNSGIGTITSTGTNSFNINIPAIPVTTITSSGIGTVTSSGTNSFNINIPVTPITTITSSGMGTISSLGTNSFDINVPQPTLSISGNSISVSGGNTITLPTSSAPTLSITGNSLSISGGNSVTVPASSIVSSGAAITTTLGTNSYSIHVPQPTLSISGNNLSISAGNTVAIPAQVTQTIIGTGLATAGSVTANSFTIDVPNPTLSINGNSLSINGGNTVTLPSQTNQTLSTSGGIATVTNGINSATIDVPSSIISSNNNTLTLTNGTVVSTATVPAQISQTLSTQGVATVTNGINSATISVANPVLSNTANVLSINQGTAISTVTLPAQANQTLSTSGGIATVTNGINSATIDVPSSIISSNNNTLTLTNGTVVSTATVPAQVSQTLSAQGVASVSNGVNSATISVANPVLSNTANVLSINQGTAVSTVTLPAQVNQTISALGIATVTNGIHSATISVDQPTFAYSQTTGSLTSGTSSAYITPSLTISGNTLSSGPTSNSVVLPSGWSLMGNAGTSTLTNFIGTTDNVDLNFRVNNTRAGRIESASQSVYFGFQAGPTTNTATGNTGIGFNALAANTNGVGNTAIGYLASLSNDTGIWNTSVGGASQMGNTSGISNTSLGYQSLRNNTTGSNNLAVGANALGSGVLGSDNTAVGFAALGTSTAGSGNTAIGFQSGNNNVNGSANVFLGYQAGFHETGSNKLYISNSSTSVTPLIYGDFSNGRLGINTTSLNAMLTVDAQSLTAPYGIHLKNARDNVGGAIPFAIDIVTNGQTFGSITYGRMIRLNNSTTSQMFDMGIGVANNFFIANGNNYTPAALNISTLSNVGINTAAPTATLHVVGTTRLVDGTQGAGKYLTSDASGNASWTSVNSGTNALWSTIGNSGTGSTNFIGTTDNVPLKFRVSNTNAGSIDPILLNSFFGFQSGSAITTGNGNVGLGYLSLNANNTGNSNVALGNRALSSNLGGNANSALGTDALLFNTSGIFNTAVGLNAGRGNTIGNTNSAFGRDALYSNSVGSNNVAIGHQAGYSALGSSNVFIGNNAGYNETGSNKLYISNNGTSTSPLIYGDFTNGVLGVNTSTTLAAFDVRSTNQVVANFQTSGTTDRTSGIWLRNNNTTPTQWMLYNGGTGNGLGLNNGELYFESVGAKDFLIRNQASNLNETFRIAGATGFVGIGYASPSTKLSVNGDISLPITAKLFFGVGGVGTGEYINNSAAYALQFNSNSLQRMRIDNGGNINIGSSTLTPTSLLNVEGNIELSTPGVATAPARTIGFPTGAIGNHGQLTIQAKSNIASGAATSGGNLMLAAGDFNVSGAGGSYGGEVIIRAGRNVFDGTGGGNIIFQAAGGAYTERMRIEGMTGRVGIGTNAPTALLHVNGTTRLVDGTQGAGKVLTSDASGNASWATPAVATSSANVCVLKDVKPNGTNGGSFTSGAWRTRDLNTLEGNSSFISLSANQFTLQPGVYIITAQAPAYSCNDHQVLLKNITDATNAIVGLSAYAHNSNGGMNSSNLSGVITITTSKTFEIQHRCLTSQATNGFGVSNSFGINEVYTQVQIIKLQ